MILLDGKALAQEIKDNLKTQVAELNKSNIYPKLVVILVGNDFGSQKYVKNKEKACEYVGIKSEIIRLSENITEKELLEIIGRLNADITVSGILVQMPLPPHINSQNVLNEINPEKDVDGFHPVNVGNLSIGNYGFISCTPYGIIKLLEKYGIDIQGKHAVVVGRSNIVGKPMSMLFLNKSATVTICHSKTKDLQHITKQADILIVAIGKAKFINGDMIKEGTVVIDVGMNKDENDKICGDVDFDDCKSKASYITPVPGGVGPMTIAMLMENCVRASKSQK